MLSPDSAPIAPDLTVDVEIEPDLSNAGPFVALAAATGGSVTVRDWPTVTTQAGDALREILTAMGCTVERVADGVRVEAGGGGRQRPGRGRQRAQAPAVDELNDLDKFSEAVFRR